MKFRDVVSILLAYDFACIRQQGSHRLFQGWVGGKRRLVTVAPHSDGDEVKKGTLGSIIRQSGLPEKAFRK